MRPGRPPAGWRPRQGAEQVQARAQRSNDDTGTIPGGGAFIGRWVTFGLGVVWLSGGPADGPGDLPEQDDTSEVIDYEAIDYLPRGE